MTTINFKGYSTMMVLEFVCNNYQYIGGHQGWYTCAVALEHLLQTGRLNSVIHNHIKSIPGNKLFGMIKRMADDSKNLMFSYDQHHFENEWIIKLNKVTP